MAKQPAETQAIAEATFHALRKMDARCPTGLCDYVSYYSPYKGMSRKSESAITWGVTEALSEQSKQWKIEQSEHDYPNGGGRCDRIIDLPDGNRLWLEIKLSLRKWFYDGIKENSPFMYNGYFSGEYHRNNVSADFTKLERVGQKDGRYAALLVIGFDGSDGQMAKDMKKLIARDGLTKRGWRFAADAWPTTQSAECWIRCWFAWRKIE